MTDIYLRWGLQTAPGDGPPPCGRRATEADILANMKRAAQAPSVDSSDPAHAERLGDFARARALSLQAQNLGSKAAQETARDRYRRLGADPMAWRVGLGALGAYMAVWIYALTANR